MKQRIFIVANHTNTTTLCVKEEGYDNDNLFYLNLYWEVEEQAR